MARKDVLKEIKGFGGTKTKKTKNPISSKQQQPSTKSLPEPSVPVKEQWQAFQCLNQDDLSSWHQTCEGTFQECFTVVQNSINLEIDEIVNKNGEVDEIWDKYADDEVNLNQKMDELYLPHVQVIKQECFKSGGYRGEAWALSLNSHAAKFGLHEAKGIYSHSDAWAGWEQVGEDAKDPKSWRLVVNDNLEKCLEGMMFFLTIEIEYATEGQLTDDMYVGDFFIYQKRLRSQLAQEVKRVCTINGEYMGSGWSIQSLKSEGDCWEALKAAG